MLFPAAMLILFLLASIAVDAAVLHLRQRELVTAAQSAAQDAATFAVDEAALRRGEWRLDPARAEQAAATALEVAGLAPLLDGPPQVDVEGDRVHVVLHARAEVVFGVLGGSDTSEPITARASAVAPRR
jgi:Tfp pilus assembly protein PilX